MKLVPIFAGDKASIPAGLYAVWFNPDDETLNEYDAFLAWAQDAQKLLEFFTKRKSKLDYGFYKGTTVKDAISRTRAEVLAFDSELEKALEQGLDNLISYLNKCFKALNNQSYSQQNIQEQKSRGRSNKYWIRIYAVKVTNDFYIVTGGTVKLVKFIEEDRVLKDERKKLKKLRDFLTQEGLYDPEAYQELILEK